MQSEENKDYSVIYREKEVKELERRLDKTRTALVFSGASLMAAGVLFHFMDNGIDLLYMTMYLITGALLITLGTVSRRKPYRRLLLGVLFLAIFWVADVLMDESELILRDNGLKLLVLSILLLAMKPAKEAEIIKKDLHLS